jgi:deoxyribose-phosphate aldolase
VCPTPSRTPSFLEFVTLDVNLNAPENVAAIIDHTLLKPQATREDVARLCAEAREFKFAVVCVNPFWVKFAAEALAGFGVGVCTVVGFPLGANETRTKIAEADQALSEGAIELDMVQNIGALRSEDRNFVRKELSELTKIAHSSGAILKVILETCMLTDKQKITACQLAVEAGADFVKTSTGFSAGGATVEDVALMRRSVDARVGVKAAGGVRTLAALRQMVLAGANRIGTSSGVSILRELVEASEMSRETPKPACIVE